MATRRPAPPPTDDDTQALEDLGLPDPAGYGDEPGEGEDDGDINAPDRPALLRGENVAELGNVWMTTNTGGGITPTEEWLPMVWMTVKVGSVPNFTERGLQAMKMTPFCLTHPMPPGLRAQMNKPMPNRPYGFYWRYLWDLPPNELSLAKRDGRGRVITKKDVKGRPLTDAKGQPLPEMAIVNDCGNHLTYTDPLSKRKMRTCPLANCPHHPRPQGIHHSVWMAQKYIGSLKSEAVIDMVVREYDPRPDVAAFAQEVIRHRNQQLSIATGFGDGDRIGLKY